MSEQMTQYQKDLVRMWDSLREQYKGEPRCVKVCCTSCPLNECCNSKGNISFNAEKSIEVVTRWAKEHPIVTYEQKYEETFGVEPRKVSISGIVTADYSCPKGAGFCANIDCQDIQCSRCKEDFWKSEYKLPEKGGE